ncbi:nitroreductase family protein [candidate division WOR-3 bacterium]|nr:nitroreductase family protein [candidate division WOR-3 bacterium]TET77213.1 MAG: NAD(P)H nitroreductase [Candidatus Cloacimonadota bacterium]
MGNLTLDKVIRRRKSVRMYQGREIDKEILKMIIESSRFAPSACNTQPWRFVVVTDREKVNMIFEKSLGGIVSNYWARTAPVFIVACAKKSVLVHKIGAGLRNIPYHFLDMGAAIEHLLLKAAELGLGTCWIGWFDKKVIRKILHIPKSIDIVSLISIGYESRKSEQKPRQRLELDEILFLNQYGEPFE